MAVSDYLICLWYGKTKIPLCGEYAADSVEQAVSQAIAAAKAAGARAKGNLRIDVSPIQRREKEL